MNLVTSILQHAMDDPKRIALTDQQSSLTYSVLVHRIKRIALGLKQQHVHGHDKIVILSANRIEFVEVFLGAVYAGCIPVPLDPKWSKAEVDAVIEQCQPAMIFADQALANNLSLEDREIRLLTFSDEEEGSYDRWLEPLQPEAEMDDTNECLFIGFTSGTTGMPKGYLRSHLSWIKSFESTREAFRLNPMEHFSAPGPFVHSLSLFALMQSLYFGATFHIIRHFTAGKVLELCKQVPEVILFVVPTMIESMMQEASPGQTRIQALISSGGKWSEASMMRCKEIFGDAKLYEYYGSSEASYISYTDVYADNKPDSVGRPFNGVKVSIRDEHFQEVPSGTIGQLYIRSGMIFSGYDHLPDETASVFRDEWLRLGDYASMDADGFLRLAGRAKNMIISGGLNVFPEEVESVLQRLPEIAEVMVFGVPDVYWGEAVTALVRWNGEKRLSTEEIKQYCRHDLASYKAPKQLITVDKFIYTSSGKIARHAMKESVKRVMI